MTDFIEVKEWLKLNEFSFGETPLYDEKNEVCGRVLWLEVGHIEFDLCGTIKNIVKY